MLSFRLVLLGVAGLMSISTLSCPVATKTQRTMYTPALLQKAQQKIATLDWPEKQIADMEERCRFFVQMSEDELWNFIPPAAQFRGLNVNFGSDCPIHGAEIHRKAGHYPWIMSRDKPFKLECPVGHEVYPSNDFKPWWIEGKPPVTPQNSSPHKKYVDNGAGWVDDKGTRYWFVPHYIFWQRWRRGVIAGVGDLAQAYLLTGKPIYGHKAAVMLARIAEQYPQMNYGKQAYHNKYPSVARGKILNYIWETSTVNALAAAYDAAYLAGQTALQSTFAAVIESVKGADKIRSAQSLLPLSANADFAGARVEYADDKGVVKTDFVLSGLDAKTAVKLPEGIEFSGQFGVASTDYLFLVNGTRLQHGEVSIQAEPLPAKIVAVDEAKNEITLNALFAPNALNGKVVTIANDLHSTSYTIQSATNRDGKTVLNFGDVLPIIAEGHVTTVDAAKGEVTTDTVLTGSARVDSGRHEGRWLTDATYTFKREIKAFDGKVFKLDGAIPGGAFANGRFFIVDFGIGDDVQVPPIQFVRVNGAGQYQIRSTTPLTLTVPAVRGESFVRLGSAWQPLKTPVVDGRLTVRLDPPQFTNGEAMLLIGKPPSSLPQSTLARPVEDKNP